MKILKSQLSLFLCLIILISAVFIPINIIVKAETNIVTLSPEQFTLSARANCSIEGNKVISSANLYPQFYVNLPSGYYAKSMEITATITKHDPDGTYSSTTFTYRPNANVQLLSNGTQIQTVGGWASIFSEVETKTFSFNISEVNHATPIDRIGFFGAWSSTPIEGLLTLTIDQVTITESGVIQASELVLKEITASEIDLEWSLNDNETAELWYSEKPIDVNNLSDATKVSEGKTSAYTLENLSENKMYYISLKLIDGAKSGWYHTSATTLSSQPKEPIVLTAEDFSITNVSNATLDNDSIVASTSRNPQFDIALPSPYYIESIKITLSTVGNGFVINDNGIQLYSEDVLIGNVGSNSGFASDSTITQHFYVNHELQDKSYDTLRIAGKWYYLPTGGEDTIKIEKIEIVGKEALIPPTLDFVNTTGNSVDVSWELPQNTSVELWYSEQELTAANFEAITNKTMVKNGEISNATVEGLTERKAYYFLLKLIRDEDVVYSTGKVYPQSLDDEIIIIDGSDLTLTKQNNCTVKDNTMTSAANQYPQFYLELPESYYIRSIVVTGTMTDHNGATTDFRYIPNNGVQLYSGNTKVQSFGGYASIFTEGMTREYAMTVSESNYGTEIDRIFFGGYWNSAPASGQLTLSIDKVEINGYRKVDAPQLEFDKITKKSVNVNWSIPNNVGVKLWRSETEMTYENFESVTDKTMVASGRISSAECGNLTADKTYYFALEIFNGNQKLYSFASVVPRGAVYDFEDSLKLNDYTVKTRKNSKTFYHINGGYGTSVSIVETEKYSDYGNAFEMNWGEWSDNWRWPILSFYAPNWADYSGKGISLTVGKTTNNVGESISVQSKVVLYVDGYEGYFVYEKDAFTTGLFPKDINKQTKSYSYDKFVWSKDENIKFSEDLSQHITNIGIFFNVPKSSGQFKLYFDSIRVEEPIKIVREVEALEFANKTMTVNEGEVFSQEVVFSPYNATENEIVWSSSDSSIVSVDEKTGKVNATTFGSAYITAKAPNNVSKSYKVIVKQDTRGMQYRDLFTFDDGSIPENMSVASATTSLEYVKVDSNASLYLNSTGKSIKAEFTPEDFAFYGSGITFWCCGNIEKTMKISLTTKSGKTFSYVANIDTEDGIVSTIDYNLFKLDGVGIAPTRDEIIDFEKLVFAYNGSIYIDSIKVTDPLTVNLKQSPENTLKNTIAEIRDSNNYLGNLKYYLEMLEVGRDYDWAVNALKEIELISSANEASIYSLYFVDDDFVQKDLKGNVTVTLDIPMALQGMNNIWILYMADGEVQGVTAHINGNKISFETSKSGVYCMVAGIGDQFITKKIKSATEIQIMTFGGTEPQEITTTKETIMRKKPSAQKNNNLWILWIIIPVAVLVIAGISITTIILVKKNRKAKI